MDCSPPGSSVQGLSSQDYWSGLPFPSPQDLPNPGIKPTSLALQVDSLLSEPSGKPPQFSDIIKIPLSLGRKLRHIDPPPRPLFASPRSRAHPPALHPQWNELYGLRSPSGGLCHHRRGWPGSRAVNGGAEGGVWLEEQLLCVCIGGGQH